jgi:nicotinamide mononucleotide transporter
MGYLEILGVLLSLVYVVLMVRQNIWCWLFGILGSLLSILIFIEAKLYSESILYAFYVGVGIYGWVRWHTKDHKGIPIKKWGILNHLLTLFFGLLGALGLGYFFSTQSDAESPYFDAFTTSFSFVASFLEAHKILSSWVYWIILNMMTIYLYATKEIYLYAGYSGLLTILSVIGFIRWQRDYRKQITNDVFFEELN